MGQKVSVMLETGSDMFAPICSFPAAIPQCGVATPRLQARSFFPLFGMVAVIVGGAVTVGVPLIVCMIVGVPVIMAVIVPMVMTVMVVIVVVPVGMIVGMVVT